jgi:hypothetical protein
MFFEMFYLIFAQIYIHNFLLNILYLDVFHYKYLSFLSKNFSENKISQIGVFHRQ